MSISSYYNNLIDSSNEFVADKQDENAVLSGQEERLRDELDVERLQARKLKKAMNSLKEKMNSFLRENGGLFSLDSEQKDYFLGLLDKHSNLSSKWKSSNSLKYSLTQNITSINNRIYSNNLSIFNKTLDIAEYQNEKNLFIRISEEIV